MYCSITFIWIFHIVFASSFEVNEDMQKLLVKACEDANEEIQQSGSVRAPQITYPSVPSLPFPSVPSTSAYFMLPYLLFDPLNQFPFLFKIPSVRIPCPLCSRTGITQNIICDTTLWKNGASNRLQPRLIHDTEYPILLVSKLYSCGNGHREIAACDPDIVKLVPDTFVDFITSHRSGLTKRLLYLCEQLMDKGISLSGIEELNQQRYENSYKVMQKRLKTQRSITRALGNCYYKETVG